MCDVSVCTKISCNGGSLIESDTLWECIFFNLRMCACIKAYVADVYMFHDCTSCHYV